MRKREIILGKSYNGTKVVGKSERERYYIVVCGTCGNVYEARSDRIGLYDRCIKCSARARMIDLTGKRFGMLTVVGLAERRKATMWRCVCDCGKERVVSSQNLRSGCHISCGCLKRSISAPAARARRKCYSDETINQGKPITTHPLHHCWVSMISRCTNSHNAEYKNYGARGISVCDRWMDENGFEHFVRDMGDKPSKKHSLDRIDVNGNYEPTNCRWATPKEQCRNMRSTMYVFYGEKKMTFRDFCDKFNLPFPNFYKRLKKGYDINFVLRNFNKDFGSHEILSIKENYRNNNKVIRLKEYEF